LIAAVVGLQVADKGVLCGIPMDTRAYTPNATPEAGSTDAWPNAENHQYAWIELKHELRGRLFSMTPDCFTMDLLGGFDASFFRGL